MASSPDRGRSRRHRRAVRRFRSHGSRPIRHTIWMSSTMLQGPSAAHWLGTDEVGRDVLSRTIFAARISSQVALVAVGVGLVGGTIIGVLAAYFGGWIDLVLMRLMELLFSFPGNPARGHSAWPASAPASSMPCSPSASSSSPALLAWRGPPPSGVAPAICRCGARHRHGRWPHRVSRDPAQYRGAAPWSRRPCLRLCDLAGIGAVLSSGSGRSRPSPPGAICSIPAAASWRRRHGSASCRAWRCFSCVLGFNLLGDGLRDAFDPHLKD